MFVYVYDALFTVFVYLSNERNGFDMNHIFNPHHLRLKLYSA